MVAIRSVGADAARKLQDGLPDGNDAAHDACQTPGSTDNSDVQPPARRRRGGLRPEAAQQREAAIDQLVADAAARGDCTDRFYWMLVYDLEMAPMTSNMKQLTDLGIAIPPPDELDDRQLQTKLWEVIESLGDLGVYFLRTDSLSDRELYSRLFNEILVEPVRDLPPTDGVSEFIDLCAGKEDSAPDAMPRFDRDRFLPKPECEPPQK